MTSSCSNKLTHFSCVVVLYFLVVWPYWLETHSSELRWNDFQEYMWTDHVISLRTGNICISYDITSQNLSRKSFHKLFAKISTNCRNSAPLKKPCIPKLRLVDLGPDDRVWNFMLQTPYIPRNLHTILHAIIWAYVSKELNVHYYEPKRTRNSGLLCWWPILSEVIVTRLQVSCGDSTK